MLYTINQEKYGSIYNHSGSFNIESMIIVTMIFIAIEIMIMTDMATIASMWMIR